ncbi:hypothetical protein D3C75_1133080 [compost metagenome]
MPSALDTLELRIKPAIPAHRPQNIYTASSTVLERMPARRLAMGLHPTDSMNRPRAVLRVNNEAARNTAVTIKMENGSVAKEPVPIYL